MPPAPAGFAEATTATVVCMCGACAGEEGEPGSEGGAGGGPGAGGGGGPATPEELEFEDDDGTTYVWDHKLRKYMPKQASECGCCGTVLPLGGEGGGGGRR